MRHNCFRSSRMPCLPSPGSFSPLAPLVIRHSYRLRSRRGDARALALISRPRDKTLVAATARVGAIRSGVSYRSRAAAVPQRRATRAGDNEQRALKRWQAQLASMLWDPIGEDDSMFRKNPFNSTSYWHSFTLWGERRHRSQLWSPRLALELEH